MAETPNHDYNVPEEGTENWHAPLNENFEDFDVDIEVRDLEENLDTYDAEEGSKFLATDTGVVYVSNGDGWDATHVLGRLDDGDGDTAIVFGTGDDDSITIQEDGVSVAGNIEVSGTKHFVQAVQTPAGKREVVYTAAESPTPRTETSGVASLEDGRAEIDLPEHFGWVTAADEPLLVQTTPYAVDSAGLAVLERSVDRLVVADRDGTGDYEFSYTVSGTRAGHEDKEVVRIPREASESAGSVPFLKTSQPEADD